jgi:hypothetical protein
MVLLKIRVSWDVTRCRRVVYTEISYKYTAFLCMVKHGYFLPLKPEDEGTMFF